MVGRQPVHRVALLGGSFDPPHRGHLALARAALEQLPVDELWWLPAGQPWQKSRSLTDAAHRLAMLQLLIGGGGDDGVDAHTDRQRIETCEIDRGGPTYTIDTLEQLTRLHPGVQWTLVIGQDQLKGLTSWHRWQDVVLRANLAVAMRPESQPLAPSDLHAPAGVFITRVRMSPDSVSSTAIRQALSTVDLTTAATVPGLTPEVARYIAQQGLYRPTG